MIYVFIYLLLIYFAAKSFVVSIWFKAPGWLKGCLLVSGRGSGKSQTPGGEEGPLKGLWAPKAPSHA